MRRGEQIKNIVRVNLEYVVKVFAGPIEGEGVRVMWSRKNIVFQDDVVVVGRGLRGSVNTMEELG